MAMRDVMSEWLALKSQLKAARADLGVLNKREKELRTEVQQYMRTLKTEEDVNTVRLEDKKVSYQQKESRGSITKEVILKGLRAFFGNNEAQIEGCFQSILDSAPVKEKTVLTVRTA